MKRPWKQSIKVLGMLLLLLTLIACKPAEEASDTLKQGAGDTVKQIDRSQTMSDLTSITAAMQGYYLQHNKYPDKISDLKLRLYHPEDIDYDPKTGRVRSKTFPEM